MKLPLLGITLFLTAAAANAQTIIDMGRLPGGTYSYGGLLSDDGSIASGNGDIAFDQGRGWRWTLATGLQNLGVSPGADHSYAYGMSGDGLVIVGASGDQVYDTACRWTQGTGMQSLGAIAAGRSSFASDASTNGDIVFGFGYEANSSESAWTWTSATGMQRFGQRLPGTSHSAGLAMTGDGSFYTGFCFNNAPALIYPTACRWAADGSIISLGTLPGSVWSVPGDLSANGEIIVGYAADANGDNYRAFKWTEATGMQDLGFPADCTAASAVSISGDGFIITGYGVNGSTIRPCLWVNGGPPQLLETYLQARGVSTSEWTLQTAAVSLDGSTMAGTGMHFGITSAWYVHLGCYGAPTITQQPFSQTAIIGQPVTFSVIATGGAINYQWYKGTTLLPNAIHSFYTISASNYADAGNYSCTLTSACGTATSIAATLTVQSDCPVPEILSHPVDVVTILGQSASFEVSATSNTEFHYQWLLEGNEIFGATDSRFDIEEVTVGDIGMYECVVTNDCGSVTGNAAFLSVCRPDFNHDQTVDFFDYLDFVDAFANALPSADFNRDGVLDFFDYLDFVDAFSTGC